MHDARKAAALFFSLAAAAAAATAVACVPPVSPTPPPATAPAREVALSGAAIMIGSGDIASCGQNDDWLTANIVDSILKADSVAGVPDAVFTLGDNVYPNATAAQWTNCWTPTWGDPTKRIMNKIHPVPGNHEYYTVNATPYFKYFGAKAGPPGLGYYSYDVGTWHAIAINSEILLLSSYSAGERAAMLAWLTKDLADNAAKKCTVAYWHEPRFSSGWHGSDARLAPLWRILYDGNADLILNGHDHNYERFAPQDPAGLPDSVRGITAIVAGAGGEALRGFDNKAIANSLIRVEGYAGILLLTLGAAEYKSAFLDVRGNIWDASGGKCH